MARKKRNAGSVDRRWGSSNKSRNGIPRRHIRRFNKKPALARSLTAAT